MDVLGDRLHSGLVIIKPGHDLGVTLPSTFQVATAEHPLPGQGAWNVGRQAAALATNWMKTISAVPDFGRGFIAVCLTICGD